MRRPRLKRRRIPRHTRKITIMQPIQHFRLLLHPRILEPILAIQARPMAQRGSRALGIRLAVVRLLPARADEEHVADFDVAALSGGADVDSLVFAAGVELVKGDGVVVEGVVGDAFFVGVAAVVEEDAAAGDAVLGPVVDGAFVVCCGADDVAAFGLDGVIRGGG